MLIVIIFRPGNCVCMDVFLSTQSLSQYRSPLLQVASLRSYIEHKIYNRLERRRIFDSIQGCLDVIIMLTFLLYLTDILYTFNK